MSQSAVRNPWLELPTEPPYILPEDRASIADLNHRHSVNGHSDRKINDRSIPEPFIGNPELARVVLLNLNPGDAPEDSEAHRNPQFREAMMRNLRHESQEYPFYALNPAFAWTGCAKWWVKHLRGLFDFGGLERRIVAQHLCVIEWFPYHSRRAGLPTRAVCPSQEYSFDIAKRMLKTKLIVGMRARERWTEVDQRFGEISYMTSCQNPTVSIGSLGESLFWQIVEALSNGASA
jgi:hypothetical protein